MKSGLWTVIVVVTAIVGFLTGYSVSSYTGVRNLRSESRGHGGGAAEASGGYGGAGDGAHAPGGAAAPGEHGARPAAGY